MNTEETKTEITVEIEAIHYLYKRGVLTLRMPKGCKLPDIRTYLHNNLDKVTALPTVEVLTVVTKLFIVKGEPSLAEQAQVAWVASGEDDGPSPFSHTKDTWIAGWIAGKS